MAEESKLPDQETFTREELSQEWKCPQSKIDAYIRSGQLKEALPPAAMRDLRRWIFYKCEDNEPLLNPVDIDAGDSCEWLLDLIEDGEPLGKYIGKIAQEKVVHCPKHLYMPTEEDIIIERHNEDYNLVRYFYSSDGSALIPLDYADDGERICFAPIKKHHLASLIIPLKEAKRLKNKRAQTERKSKRKPSATVERDAQITQEEQKNSDTPSLSSKTFNEYQPSSDERILRMPEVLQRVGLSKSHIYTLMDKGQFPKSIPITGYRAKGWHESVVDAWIEEKKRKNE